MVRGDSRSFAADRLWLYIGSPMKLTATVNGRSVALPGRAAPKVMIATATGVVALISG